MGQNTHLFAFYLLKLFSWCGSRHTQDGPNTPQLFFFRKMCLLCGRRRRHGVYCAKGCRNRGMNTNCEKALSTLCSIASSLSPDPIWSGYVVAAAVMIDDARGSISRTTSSRSKLLHYSGAKFACPLKCDPYSLPPFFMHHHLSLYHQQQSLVTQLWNLFTTI